MQLVIRNKMLLCTSTLDVGWWYSRLAEVVNGTIYWSEVQGDRHSNRFALQVSIYGNWAFSAGLTPGNGYYNSITVAV